MKNYYQILGPIWEGYETGDYLGGGSFGDVWELKKKGDCSEVNEAVKQVRIPPQEMGDMEEAILQGMDHDGAQFFFEGMKTDMLKEIEMMQKLAQFPEIVHIHDFRVRELAADHNEYGWVIFVRMEKLVPVKTYLRKNGITVQELIQLTADLCSALEECKKHSIVHRDVKLENIFYSENTKRFKLGDFGDARYLSRVSEPCGVPGTLTHMSPEVFRGQPYTYMSDLYAVGMIIYKLLNDNRVPFLPLYPEKYTPAMRDRALQKRLQGAEIEKASVCYSTVNTPHPTLRLESGSIEKISELEKIARKAIDSEVEKRYPTAQDLKDAVLSI